jgi:hypothetical protein
VIIVPAVLKHIVPPWKGVRQESLADLVSCEVLTM